jgi:hypothetical protein
MTIVNDTGVRRLTRSVTVTTPSSFALAFMNTYFLERGSETNGAQLALRFPLPRFIIDGLTLEKRVLVRLKYTASSSSSDHPLMIDWQPLGNGPLPAFTGTLAATQQTDTRCTLAIDGSYLPPGGPAGAIFDQLIGVRIANATITALLEQFKKSIEADYAIRLVP